VVSVEDILMMQDLVMMVPAAAHVIRYAMRVTRSTRPVAQPGDDSPPVPDFVKKYVSWGAGPRAGQNLILAAKARAVLQGRPHVALEDVRAVAPPVLRHRVMTNYHAEAEGISPDDIVTRLLNLIPRE
jgi:MoxR-like ATPase